MSYRRSLSTLGCPEFALGEALALADRHGLDGIELRSLGGTVDLPAYFTRKFGTPEQLRAQLPAGQILALDTSFALVGATPSAREALLQHVPWAEVLGVARLRVFDGGRTADEVELAEAAATCQWWHELREHHGWKTDLMVETHDSLFKAEAIGRFLAVAPGTAILWDTHHTWKKGGEDPMVTWSAIKAHVAHIHVKDSVSQPSSRLPFTYVLPGEGEFPMAPLRQILQAEYRGFVSLEWEKLWHPYLPSLEQALTAASARHWW
jgi:sugar phosphate isomerase/epimerase